MYLRKSLTPGSKKESDLALKYHNLLLTVTLTLHCADQSRAVAGTNKVIIFNVTSLWNNMNLSLMVSAVVSDQCKFNNLSN